MAAICAKEKANPTAEVVCKFNGQPILQAKHVQIDSGGMESSVTIPGENTEIKVTTPHMNWWGALDYIFWQKLHLYYRSRRHDMGDGLISAMETLTKKTFGVHDGEYRIIVRVQGWDKLWHSNEPCDAENPASL